MFVSAVSLENFRNYNQLHLNLTEGFTLFYGENGEGKTNLVESIGFLATLESHRVSGYQALINANAETARISVVANSNSRKITPAVELNRSQPNRYFLNGTQQKRAQEIIGAVSATVFAPEDLDLVRRDPSDRRAFLDALAIQLRPRLSGVKADYDRVLKQRNALLKTARQTSAKDLTTLDIWDDQLVGFGTELIIARLELIANLEPLLSDFYKNLSGKQETISLELRSSIFGSESEEEYEAIAGDPEEIAREFSSTLSEIRAKEIERGITLAGPHRDELLISKTGQPARTHASQGEAWSIALGAKLAAAELLRNDSKTGDPVIILDDVFSVLDAGRRARLIEFAKGFEQVIITATSSDGLPELEWAAKHRVVSGSVTS